MPIHHATGREFPRGAIPSPRHVLAAAIPYRNAKGPPPAYFFIFPRKLSMWLNDTYGDCVTAEEAFNKACAGIFIEDSTVLSWARGNGVLNGAELQPVIQQMQARGFSQDGNVYGDGAPLAVDYTNGPLLQAAIYQAGQQGGCVKIGIAAGQLPSSAGNQNGWFLTSNRQDSSEDHCVALPGYGTAQQFVTAMNAAFNLNLAVPSGVDPTMQGYALYTWKTIGFVSVQAMINMTGEAWLRNPSSVNTGTGTPDPDSVYSTVSPPPPPPPPPPAPPPPPGPPPPPPLPAEMGAMVLSRPLPVGMYAVGGQSILMAKNALQAGVRYVLQPQQMPDVASLVVQVAMQPGVFNVTDSAGQAGQLLVEASLPIGVYSLNVAVVPPVTVGSVCLDLAVTQGAYVVSGLGNLIVDKDSQPGKYPIVFSMKHPTPFLESRMTPLPEPLLNATPVAHRSAVENLANAIHAQAPPKITWQMIVNWIMANLPLIMSLLTSGVSWDKIAALVISILSGLNPPAPSPVPPAA